MKFVWARGEVPRMVDHHPTPVLLLSSQPGCAVIELQNSKSFAFYLHPSFSSTSLCRFDVEMSKELYELAEWWWACLQDVPYVTSTLRDQANQFTSVRFPDFRSSSFIQAGLTNSDFFWICEFCLKKTHKDTGKLLMKLLTCISEVERLPSALEKASGIEHTGGVAMFLFHPNVSTNRRYLRNDKLGEEAENGCESWSCSLWSTCNKTIAVWETGVT